MLRLFARLLCTATPQVERHPDAEHLYVESIDLGDASGPRTVVSGLVKFMSADELLGARVVCLCNLKPAAMRGVVSHAMVLAASDAEHTRVEVVTPPEGAVVGEAVTFEGYANQPDEQLNPKKKVCDGARAFPFHAGCVRVGMPQPSRAGAQVWEAVQPDLRTDAACVASYRGLPFTTSAGVCRVASLAEGVIK